jgi:hypothetical protein
MLRLDSGLAPPVLSTGVGLQFFDELTAQLGLDGLGVETAVSAIFELLQLGQRDRIFHGETHCIQACLLSHLFELLTLLLNPWACHCSPFKEVESLFMTGEFTPPLLIDHPAASGGQTSKTNIAGVVIHKLDASTKWAGHLQIEMSMTSKILTKCAAKLNPLLGNAELQSCTLISDTPCQPKRCTQDFIDSSLPAFPTDTQCS